ncbi:MAG: hypothetical protein JWM78_1632 [Verrucomicrobiaceae bacterium]|nr:hypothetical protein [Verrucomicrobiaceae bacterium]
MLQRAKQIKKSPLREANRLLEMRDQKRESLGESIYLEKTLALQPLVRAAYFRTLCPVRAASLVVIELKIEPMNREAKQLITCAALDLHFSTEQLPLAS